MDARASECEIKIESVVGFKWKRRCFPGYNPRSGEDLVAVYTEKRDGEDDDNGDDHDDNDKKIYR